MFKNRRIHFYPVVLDAFFFFFPLHACVVSCCVSIHAKQSKRYELRLGTSLHRLVQVAPLVGAEGVEGGHHKLAVEGSARQQPLGLFGITGVAVFYKDLWTHGGSVTEVQLGVTFSPRRCEKS